MRPSARGGHAAKLSRMYLADWTELGLVVWNKPSTGCRWSHLSLGNTSAMGSQPLPNPTHARPSIPSSAVPSIHPHPRLSLACLSSQPDESLSPQTTSPLRPWETETAVRIVIKSCNSLSAAAAALALLLLDSPNLPVIYALQFATLIAISKTSPLQLPLSPPGFAFASAVLQRLAINGESPSFFICTYCLRSYRS